MPSAMPADILARRRELMLVGDADGFADLFAPDAVMEFAFHGPPGTPVRVESRSRRCPSRSSGSGTARSCCSVTSPIPGASKRCPPCLAWKADTDPWGGGAPDDPVTEARRRCR